MQSNRKTAVLASLGFGAVCAFMALDTPASETPLIGRTARGAGGMINSVVELLGQTGAALAFLGMGALLAVVSTALIPPWRGRR